MQWRAPMHQMRIYERKNKLSIRSHVLHLKFLWQHRSIKNKRAIFQKESICVIPFDSCCFISTFPLIVGSLCASMRPNVSARLRCLLFLSPRCRTPGLLLSSRCRWCHWLFGHRHQLNPFTNAVLLLAAIAGVASCQIVHHYAGVVFQETFYAVTSSETPAIFIHLFFFVAACELPLPYCIIYLFSYFVIFFTQHWSLKEEWLSLFCCHVQGVFRLFQMFFLALWDSCDFLFFMPNVSL